MDHTLLAALGIIAVALVFDYINGFHDAANSIATVVSTRVLTPGKAVIWAAFFNFVAAFGFGTAVAKTVGAGMVDLSVVTFAVIFAGLLGAIVWDLLTWYYGLPTSSSHALFGGYAGAAVAKAGFGAIIASGWYKTIIFIVLAPLIGMVVGLLMMTGSLWVFRRSTPSKVDHFFRKMQLVSAAAFSLMHGANDAQKTMGIISGALVTGGFLQMDGKDLPIPFWVVLLAHSAIGLGTLSGNRPRDPFWWMAHHSHDGIEDHQAPADWRVRGGNGRGAGHLDRNDARRRHQHDAHDHRRDRRCGIHAATVGSSLGRGHADRLGVAPDDPGVGGNRRDHLLPGEPVRGPVITAIHGKGRMASLSWRASLSSKTIGTLPT
jgi:inorganic phosphate transporter, PiT family